MGGREEVMVSRLGSNMEFTRARLSRFRFRPVHGAVKGKQTNLSYKKKDRYVQWDSGNNKKKVVNDLLNILALSVLWIWIHDMLCFKVKNNLTVKCNIII